MNSLIKFRNLVLLIILTGMIWQCANPVSPSGGPQDIAPPKVVGSEPPNFSIGFDKSKISITFNEYVSLKNPNQQIIVSPPLAEIPDYKLRGKSLIIDLNAPLNPNTTYSFFFGNAIVDITESNPLANYLYVLSTGNKIDSLAIGGEVISAFDLQPQEEVFVMLYPTTNDTVPMDSLPYLVRPLYVAKTDANGMFQLRYLRDEPYKIFAIKDVNNNYLFDQPNKEIAFIDSLILPEAITPPQTDSIAIDSLLATMIDKDSLYVKQAYSQFYHLLMFQGIDSTQRLLDKVVELPAKFLLVFKFPAKNPRYKVISREVPDDWKIEEINKTRDSIMVWVRDLELDSLLLEVADGDSVLDTILIEFKEKTINTGRKRNKDKDKKEAIERLRLKYNAKAMVMDLGRPFRITFENPVVNYDFTNVQFVAGEDTMIQAPFLNEDSLQRNFYLDYELEENTMYSFIIPDSCIYDIYGLTTDSVKFAFKTKEYRSYANLFLNIKLHSGDYPYIIQLLNTHQKILQSRYIESDTQLSFELLMPGKFLVKAIQDVRANRHWDTGDYMAKKQPENVFYFPAEIKIQANWDISETWTLP